MVLNSTGRPADGNFSFDPQISPSLHICIFTADISLLSVRAGTPASRQQKFTIEAQTGKLYNIYRESNGTIESQTEYTFTQTEHDSTISY